MGPAVTAYRKKILENIPAMREEMPVILSYDASKFLQDFSGPVQNLSMIRCMSLCMYHC